MVGIVVLLLPLDTMGETGVEELLSSLDEVNPAAHVDDEEVVVVEVVVVLLLLDTTGETGVCELLWTVDEDNQTPQLEESVL